MCGVKRELKRWLTGRLSRQEVYGWRGALPSGRLPRRAAKCMAGALRCQVDGWRGALPSVWLARRAANAAKWVALGHNDAGPAPVIALAAGLCALAPVARTHTPRRPKSG